MGKDTSATGRREVFEIEDHERLIGFEADHCKYGHLWGITFVKWALYTD
ncbi:MAG: hypothetical protein ACK55Z_05820 [bacterium]